MVRKGAKSIKKRSEKDEREIIIINKVVEIIMLCNYLAWLFPYLVDIGKKTENMVPMLS